MGVDEISTPSPNMVSLTTQQHEDFFVVEKVFTITYPMTYPLDSLLRLTTALVRISDQ